MTPATPIDAKALAQARKRLEDECQTFKDCPCRTHTDLRLVLDALKDAERPRADEDAPCDQCRGRAQRDMLCPACGTAHCWKCSECDDLGNPEDWE